jgi:limonene-1,2-epoxide hydrolase
MSPRPMTTWPGDPRPSWPGSGFGLERIAGYEHHLRLMVAEGDTVITEHAETWRWHSGEEVTLPFVSVHELRDGTIMRWWDYWDMQTLMNAAPAWWVEHIMQGYT